MTCNADALPRIACIGASSEMVASCSYSSLNSPAASGVVRESDDLIRGTRHDWREARGPRSSCEKGCEVKEIIVGDRQTDRKKAVKREAWARLGRCVWGGVKIGASPCFIS